MSENANPQAALAKYNYPGADKDDQVVQTVENKIKNSPMGKFQSWLDAKPPVEKSEVESKKAEAKSEMEKAAKDNPEEAKKAGPMPSVAEGTAAHPQVNAPKGAPGGDVKAKEHKGGEGPKTGAKKEVGAHKEAAKGEHKEPKSIAAQVANMGDAEMKKFLDGYPNKSKEITEKLGKIQQMQEVASGFDGKVESYISNGSMVDNAKGTLVNFLGKKELGAIFGQNPYEKVGGGLGRIMQGLSTFKNIVSIVGNVCGKIGMVLTVVGLLGMIFPPVGTAVSGIARVLNVVGLVCDGIGLVLGGILTGLNGVNLAKQISKGGSNEEKAASADMMASEANDAAGHVINLAMNFGPKFMKGFLGQSKGILAGMLKRFKAFVGKIVGKVAGNVKNWAKKLIYKMGFGLGEAKPGGGLLKKVFNAPGTALEKLRNTELVRKINNSGFMKSVEKKGLAMDKFGAKFDGEDLGTKLAGNAPATGRAKDYFDSAEKDELATVAQSKKFAAEDAANKERAAVEKEIKGDMKSAEKSVMSIQGKDKIADGKAVDKAVEKVEHADSLKAGEDKAVDKAGKEGGKEFQKQHDEKENAEKLEAKRVEEFKRNPDRFTSETKGLETRRDNLEKKLKAPDLANDEKEKLEHQIEKLNETLNQRRVIPVKAVGGETPETLKDVYSPIGESKYKEVKEAVQGLNGHDEGAEKQEERNKYVEKKFGHDVSEKREDDERHEKVEEISNESAKAPEHATESSVETMLSGIGGEAVHAHEDQGGSGGGGEGQVSEGGGEQAHGGGGKEAPTHEAKAPQASAPPPAAKEEKEEDPAVPELAYWPKLVESGGDFDKSMQQLKRMKVVGGGFRRAQLEAKKKALDTAAMFGKAKEYEEQRKLQAEQHKAHIAESKAEAQGSGQAAQQGDGKASEGEGKQGEAQAGNKPVQTDVEVPPEPTGMFAFFKKIVWRIKKWAAEKAAAVFGWVQEKIASLIMQGLCGVSMGDIKAYTTALHHRMDFSKGIAVQAEGTTDKAKEKGADTEKKAEDAGSEAVKDAQECDRNIADADAFIQDVETTEGDIAAETAKAQQFLSALKAEADSEKQRKQAEAKKKADDEAKQANAANGANQANASPGAGPGDSHENQAKAHKENQAKTKKPEVAEADKSKVKGAASFVVTKTHLYADQLSSSQREQNSRLHGAIERKPAHLRPYFAGMKPGEKVIEAFKHKAADIEGNMKAVAGAPVNTNDALHGAVDRIKSSAKELDEAAGSAHNALNGSFKEAYNAVASLGSKKKGGGSASA